MKSDPRSRLGRLCLLSLALACFAFAAQAAEPYVACEAVGKARPLCGFQNPEDLAPLPGGEALVVSEYGAMQGGTPGALALLVLASDERRVLYRGGAEARPTPGWGDPACPGAPSAAFSPHGIDLRARPDGKLALAVVQHGGRESIELFELSGAGSDWQAAWRGCLLAPQDAWLNEVVLLADGGLLTTNMMPRSNGMEKLLEAPSEPTGFVYAWSAQDGFSEQPGTRGMLPNGIEVSADDSEIFLNLSMENAVRRIERKSGEQTGRAEVSMPDNLTWSPDGKQLLVASLSPVDQTEFDACESLTRGSCALPFTIVALDPEALTTRVIYRGEGPPMGAGTVGLRVGDELFVGSFKGDRVLRVKLAD